MSTPNVSVVVEPSNATGIAYEPVAPKDASDVKKAVLCLELAIKNNESKKVHLNKVKLTLHRLRRCRTR